MDEAIGVDLLGQLYQISSASLLRARLIEGLIEGESQIRCSLRKLTEDISIAIAMLTRNQPPGPPEKVFQRQVAFKWCILHLHVGTERMKDLAVLFS